MTEQQEKIYGALDVEPMDANSIAKVTGLDLQAVRTNLAKMMKLGILMVHYGSGKPGDRKQYGYTPHDCYDL